MCLLGFLAWACVGLSPLKTGEPGPRVVGRALQVDFVSWIEDIVADMPGRDSEGFVEPTELEEADFFAAVQAFLDESWASAQTLAAAVNYEVVEIEDTGNGNETLYGLQPDPGNTDGRGHYFVRPRAAIQCELVIESPHPKFDSRTGVLSSEVFRNTGARAFLLAGTHRCANAADTLCDGLTLVCNELVSGPYRESDMAHTDRSFFQVFHEAAAEEVPGSTRVMQVHGFVSGGSDPEFTLSDGTTTDNVSDQYLPNRFAADLEQRILDAGSTKGGNSCNRVGDLNKLCATTNTQGRFINGVLSEDVCDTAASSATEFFLHAELSYDLRYPGGTLEPSLFIDSVMETFECSPTLVELVSFTATGQTQSVLIEWTTAAEIDAAGFHVLRSESAYGIYQRVNETLIPARGGPAQGADYSFLDDHGIEPGKIYYYKLKVMAPDGRVAEHGPAEATPGHSCFISNAGGRG